MKRVSLKDIARMTGASPSTVSFVLNGKAREMRISDDLAKKIVATAKKEGYHPNQVAVRLRTGKSQMLGLIVESISGNFFAALAKVIEQEAEQYGYKVVYCATENDGKKGQELIRMLSQQQVDGYIITPALGMEEDVQELIDMKKPVVLLDSYFPNIDVPHVLVDNHGGVVKGMKHLISRGYRKIAFVTVDLQLIQMKDRLQAYTESLKAANIPVNRKYILSLGYKAKKEEAIAQIAAFLKNTPGLDALFFATNYLGLLGIESLQQLGITIPKDVAMMSFDDHDVFRLFPPGITIIEQPVEEIAKTAINLLMIQLGKNKATKKNKVQLPAKLVIRGTT
jgi:LacI family transcriptional regulator